MRKYVFDLKFPGVAAAGISGATDRITVTLDSGDPDRPIAQFQDDLKWGFEDLFPSAKVTFNAEESS